MQKYFENVSELTTRTDYDTALAHVKKLITEASSNGKADDEYVHEIGRIGHLCAACEDTRIEYEYFTVRKRMPKVLEYV